MNVTVNGNQGFPEISMAADGRFVVAWESGSALDRGRDIHVRQFDSQLKGGDEIIVGGNRDGHQSFPAVAMNAFGGFVVVWDTELSPEHRIFAQQFSADGELAGAPLPVNNTLARQAYSPSVAANVVGDFVVVWDVFGKDGHQQGSFGRRFESDGALQGSEFQLNTTTNEDQSLPAVAMDDHGEFVAVWNSQDQDGEGLGVFGQRFGIVSTAGSISGYVYVNGNNNGILDPLELGLPNVTITIRGPVSRTVTTDENGQYTFVALPPGSYDICEVQPPAYLDGIDTLGTPPSGAVGLDAFLGVTLSAGLTMTGYNFGEREVGSDQAAVTVEDVSAVEGAGLVFTVTLDRAVAGGTNVSVTLTERHGQGRSGTAGNAGGLRPRGGPVDVRRDGRRDAAVHRGDAGRRGAGRRETFAVSLDAVNALVTDSDTATGTITDNDSAAVTVEDVSAVEGAGLVFTVTLDRAVAGGTNVSVTLTDVTARAERHRWQRRRITTTWWPS